MQARVPKTGMDVFGNSDASSLSEEVTCNSCGRRVAASRLDTSVQGFCNHGHVEACSL